MNACAAATSRMHSASRGAPLSSVPTTQPHRLASIRRHLVSWMHGRLVGGFVLSLCSFQACLMLGFVILLGRAKAETTRGNLFLPNGGVP